MEGQVQEPVALDFRVRYAETDAMGVVYYANYFVWFELGRTEWIRAHGVTYRIRRGVRGGVDSDAAKVDIERPGRRRGGGR